MKAPAILAPLVHGEVASFDGLIEEIADVTPFDWDEFEASLANDDDDDNWL